MVAFVSIQLIFCYHFKIRANLSVSISLQLMHLEKDHLCIITFLVCQCYFSYAIYKPFNPPLLTKYLVNFTWVPVYKRLAGYSKCMLTALTLEQNQCASTSLLFLPIVTVAKNMSQGDVEVNAHCFLNTINGPLASSSLFECCKFKSHEPWIRHDMMSFSRAIFYLLIIYK